MYTLTDDEQLVLDSLKRIIDREIAPRARELDETGEFSWEIARVLAENGFLSPLLPAAYGGSEVSLLLFAQMIEAIAKVCASSALLLMAQADGMLPILHGASEAQRQQYLPRLAETPALVALAVTEPEAGSDVLSMRTRAVRQGDHYVIDGSKCFITNGELADFFTLYAYTAPDHRAKGVSAFIVEKGTPGLSYGKKENKMGMRGSVNSTLFFESMKIPAGNLLGEEGSGFYNLMAALAGSRLFSAAQAVGIAHGALDHARDHARQRVQFGQPIAKLPVIRQLIAEMATQVEAARLLVYRAAEVSQQGGDRSGRLSAMAKVFASDAAMSVTTEAVQVLGGYGYSKEYPVERLMRDAKLTQIYTGTNQVLRQVIARAELD
jgi:cyclohex-1-ene-1-carbonyl-CoA dehydrogenase